MNRNQFKKELEDLKTSIELIQKDTPKSDPTELEMILNEIMNGKSQHNILLRSALTQLSFIIDTINAENKELSQKELQGLYLKHEGYVKSFKRIKTVISSYLNLIKYVPSNSIKLFLEG